MGFFPHAQGKTSHSLNTHPFVHHQVFNRCVQSLGHNRLMTGCASMSKGNAVFITLPSLRGWISVPGLVSEIYLASLMDIQ